MTPRILSSALQSSPRIFLPLAASVLLAAVPQLDAVEYTWLPTDVGPFNWNNAGGQDNWNLPAAFPNAPGDIANVTSNLTLDQQIDLNVPITIGVLNLGDSDGTNAFTITAGTGGGLIFNNSGATAQINHSGTGLEDTITAGVSVVGDLALSNAAPASLVLSGSLSSAANTGTQTVTAAVGNIRLSGDISDGGSGGKIAIVRTGTGTMSLLGNNSFTGGVTLESGTLNIGSATALGATASTFTITGGTISNTTGAPVTLINDNAQVWNGDFAFSGDSELHLGNGAVTLAGDRTISSTFSNLIVGGVVSDGASTFGLLKTGGGTLTLAGNNTFDGQVIVGSGTLGVRHANALGTNTTPIVSSGGTLALDGGVTVTGKTISLSGEGAGQGGALRGINGDNVWTGDILANTTSIVRIVAANGTLTINGNIITSGTAANGLVFQGDGTMNGVISGDASVTRSNSDPGQWTFNGVNTYTGITTISNGAIKLGNANAIQNSAVTVNSTVNGLRFASGIGTFNLVSLAGAFGSTIVLEDDAAQPVTLSIGSSNVNTTSGSSIAGTGGLVKVGTGALSLTGTSTFTGGIVVNAGTLNATDPTVVGGSTVSVFRNGLGAGAVTLNAGTTLQLRVSGENNASSQVIRYGNDLNVAGAATLSVDRQSSSGGTGKTLALGDLALGAAPLTVTSSNGFGAQFDTVTLSDNASLNAVSFAVFGNVTETGGARSFTKEGTGRVTIIGNTAHTGGTNVNAGTLQIGNGGYTGTLAGNVNNSGTLSFNRTDDSTFGGVISGAGIVSKQGAGTLTLTGTNDFTGILDVSGGTLLIDQTPGVPILTGVNPLRLGNGTFYLKGAPTGTSALTLGNLSTLGSLTGRVVLDNNGGAGTTLTLGDSWTFGGSNGLHFDLTRGGTVLSNPTQTNGVITATANGVARATVTGTDGRTYFATVTGGAIAPQTNLTPFTASSSNGSTNFNVSGEVVSDGAVSTATLRMDTTATDGFLDLNGALTYSRTAILMDGDNDFEIKTTSGTGTIANVVIHQYGNGSLTLSAPFAGGGGFTKNGGGLLIGNMTSGSPASITLTEGVYRAAVDTALPTNTLNIAGGVLEIGGSDYVAGTGTGTGQVRISSSGGFSASGGERVVNLGGAGGTLNWDSSVFLPNNSTFLLSSVHSDGTIDIRNAIALGGLTRTVQVANGSAAIDAKISGALSGTADLVKTGTGALELSGISAFSGAVQVEDGAVHVTGSIGGSVQVDRGTLGGNGDGLATGLIAGSITVGDGSGTADAILAPGLSVGKLTTLGCLSLASDAVFRFELDSSAATADQMAANGISIAAGAAFQPFELALTSTALPLGTTFIALDNTSLDPIGGLFANLADGATFVLGANTFEADYQGGTGNDLAFTVVPEPGSATSLLAGAAALLGFRRRRRRA